MLDRTQVVHFVDLLVGFDSIGAAGDQEVQRPISPEVRSFIIARLGDRTPSSVYFFHGDANSPSYANRKALAEFFRELADCIDPVSAVNERNDLLAAAKSAREIIADHITELLRSFCVFDPEGEPIRDTLTGEDAEVVEQEERVLASIDAAIAKAESP